MKFKVIACPTCGELARGSIEILAGVAEMNVNEDGTATYQGETEIWWDEQRTKVNPSGEVELICPNAHQWFSPMEV